MTMDLAPLIRNIPDFPKPGIQFKDITTLLLNAQAFKYIIDTWKQRYEHQNIHAIVAVDARGFIFGSALAYALELPFIPVRKKGKLPGDTLSEDFFLEYGSDTLEIHVGAIQAGERVVLVDDLLATGGTVEAMAKLVKKLGGEIVELCFVVELPLLRGRDRLEGYPIYSLVEFMVE